MGVFGLSAKSGLPPHLRYAPALALSYEIFEMLDDLFDEVFVHHHGGIVRTALPFVRTKLSTQAALSLQSNQSLRFHPLISSTMNP